MILCFSFFFNFTLNPAFGRQRDSGNVVSGLFVPIKTLLPLHFSLYSGGNVFEEIKIRNISSIGNRIRNLPRLQ